MRLLLAIVIQALCSCEPVFAADFSKTYYEVIKPHEGGFTADKNDAGNFYKGKLIGTNRGISAAVYGGELIKRGWSMKTLTDQQAMFLYQRDFWDAYRLGTVATQGIAEEACDELVNEGPGGVRDLMLKVKKSLEWVEGHSLPFTNIDSPEAITWLNNYTKDRAHRLLVYDLMKKYRAQFYIKLAQKKPKLRPYLLSWMSRAVQ